MSATPASVADPLPVTAQELLGRSDLDAARLEKAAGEAAKRADFADLYLSSGVSEGWSLEEGIVKTGSFSASRGMSLRAVSGDTSAFAHADEISCATLSMLGAAVKSAAFSADTDNAAGINLPRRTRAQQEHYSGASSLSANDSTKADLLRRLDKTARAKDARVRDVQAGLGASHGTVMIIRSDGEVFADVRPMVRLSAQVVLTENGVTETGHAGMGGRCSLAMFTDRAIEEMIDRALAEASAKLAAQPAPAGMMPVVLGNGWAGILLHEAVGHGLEGDFNRKGQSAYSGLIGQKVAPECVTVVDDGTLLNKRGSLNCDDEGVPSARNILIERGVLRGYMHDIVSAKLTGAQPTGNGRRESFAHLPMPRMTNTHMTAGVYKPDEVIASVDKGVYFKSFQGGQVDITNGNFVFVASEAYLIRKGRLGPPVKGATITGNGPQAMRKLSMVADDLEMDPGVGTCGKNGQWVPVGVGQPTCKVDELVVGGTQL